MTCDLFFFFGAGGFEVRVGLCYTSSDRKYPMEITGTLDSLRTNYVDLAIRLSGVSALRLRCGNTAPEEETSRPLVLHSYRHWTAPCSCSSCHTSS